MKKILFFVFTTLIVNFTFAQTKTTKQLTWDGLEREYIEIVPNSVSGAKPVMFFLHGLGDNMTDFSNVISNGVAADWIYIVPQATDWVMSIPMYGEIPFGAAWNVKAEGNYIIPIPVNSEVDDTGFLIAILDNLENNFNIDTDSVFFCGFSLGAFMANRMAIEHSDRITGVASVSGTIGNKITATPQNKLLALHIHGTADEMINYNNGNVVIEGTPVGDIDSPLGVSAEATVEYWRAFNDCNENAVFYHYMDRIPDNYNNLSLVFDRYYYLNEDEGARVGFIKAINTPHTWWQHELQHDIDYHAEIVKFFRNQWATEEYWINPITYQPNINQTNVGLSDTVISLTFSNTIPSKTDFVIEGAKFENITIEPATNLGEITRRIIGNTLEIVPENPFSANTTYTVTVPLYSLFDLYETISWQFTTGDENSNIDNILNNVFSVYPNPASSSIAIEGEFYNSTLNIFDITGKKILETSINNTKNNINISNLEKGIYIIKIGNIEQKLTIQ